MPSHPQDAPPPPYSETDIYSVSSQAGHSPVQSSARLHTPSVASTNEVIYTPPLTPQSSASLVRPNPATDGITHDANHLTVVSQEAYFESRPFEPRREREGLLSEHIRITIGITPNTQPADLAYLDEWIKRDVTRADWQTFVNHLLPHSTGNAEYAKPEIDNGDTQHSDQRTASPLRRETPLNSHLSGRQLEVAERTVGAWNDAFFEPRGLLVVADLSQMSGPETTPDIYRQDRHSSRYNDPDAPGPSTQPASSGGVSGWRRFNPFSTEFIGGAHGGNFSLGGLRIEGDRVSVGDRLVVDSRGVKIGDYSAGAEGIKINGRHVFGNTINSPGFSTQRSARSQAVAEMGRDIAAGTSRHRDASLNSLSSRTSTSSSSSSSSSSGSDASSIGSLPDWSQLKDSELPVAQHYLQNWLDHPDNGYTKEHVKGLKANLKAARKGDVVVGPSQKTIPDITSARADREVIRQEVRQLMKQWNQLRRQQRQVKKEKRRERRAIRRVERKRRKHARKADKATRKLEHHTRKQDHKAKKQARKAKRKMDENEDGLDETVSGPAHVGRDLSLSQSGGIARGEETGVTLAEKP